MRVLVVDVGNTRIKWARFDGRRLSPARAAVHAGWGAADYARRLLRPAPRPERLLVSNVAGAKMRRALANAARREGVAVRFLRVPRRAGGVTVGYREPWRLGVDRFAALVGARALFPRTPLCVVGVGTAMTIDLLGADGRHRGGAIIPAPVRMVAQLLAETDGIRRRAQGGALGARGLFGRSTRDAIVQGARHAAAALIDRAVAEATRLLKRRPAVLLTGGGAGTVQALLKSRSVEVPDLVLRGLAALAAEPLPRRRS
jgi:type III pantothenate kinase